MSQELDKEYFERLLAEQNYIAAYQYIKTNRLAEPEHSEYAGKLVGAVVEELSRVNKREDQDRIAYLRTILSWVFRDIPGLSGLYREQIRGGSSGDAVSEVYRGFRNLNDVANGRKTFGEGMEDAFQQVREVFDRASGELRDRYDQFTRSGDKPRESKGDTGDKSGGSGQAEPINEFLRGAEQTISDGLRQVGEFFESARRNAERRSTGAEDKPETPQNDVSAEDESGTTIRVDIVDDEEKDSGGKGKRNKK